MAASAVAKLLGGRFETIGGLEHIDVTMDRLVQTNGIYIEDIGGAYGLLCNQSNTTMHPAARWSSRASGST